MAVMTLVHFAILSFRGGALYNYYHHYADKAAMFDFVEKLGLTAPALGPDAPQTRRLARMARLHRPRHARQPRQLQRRRRVQQHRQHDRHRHNHHRHHALRFVRQSSARKPSPSSASRSRPSTPSHFICSARPTPHGMVALTIIGSIVYAPTIPLVWAIFADVADYSELKTGRRFTGMVFATIGFALKSGLALGSASFLWIMAWFFKYDTKLPGGRCMAGYRATAGIVVGICSPSAPGC
jgi:GPH family glycoside/pentoside/hexuronide:cation symporter